VRLPQPHRCAGYIDLLLDDDYEEHAAELRSAIRSGSWT
jgi:hypothetical protein